MTEFSWRDPLQPSTTKLKTGQAVLVRDSTPLQYLRLLSPLAPHGRSTTTVTHIRCAEPVQHNQPTPREHVYLR